MATGGSGPVVLAVVDDGVDGWPTARSHLEGAGYRVVQVAAAADAADLIQQHAPVLMLVDRDTPDAGGLPVIRVSGGFTAADLEGPGTVHDVVRWPLDPVEVLARVRATERFRALQDELAWRRRELEELGRTDVLTGLANRRQIEEHLQMAASGARRLRTAYSLLMVDVDHFRRLNDTHGRAAGDSVLFELGKRIQRALRGEDVAGRWGAEEFLVILPHTPLDGAWRLGERIRLSVCESPVELAEDRDVVVTISVGCGESYGDDVEDHIRRTELALDEAKSGGRNRVVADTTTVAP